MLKNNKVVHQLLRRMKKLEVNGVEFSSGPASARVETKIINVEVQRNINEILERLNNLEEESKKNAQASQDLRDSVSALESQTMNKFGDIEKSNNERFDQCNEKIAESNTRIGENQTRIEKLEQELANSLRNELNEHTEKITKLLEITDIHQKEMEKTKTEQNNVIQEMGNKIQETLDRLSVVDDRLNVLDTHELQIESINNDLLVHQGLLQRHSEQIDEYLTGFSVQMKSQTDYSFSMEQQITFIDRQLKQISESVAELRSQRDFIQSVETQLGPMKNTLDSMKDYGEQLRIVKGQTNAVLQELRDYMDTVSRTKVESTYDALKKLQGDLVDVSGKVEGLLEIQHEIDVIISASKERSLLKEIDMHISHKLPDYLASMMSTGTPLASKLMSFSRMPPNSAQDINAVETRIQARIDEIDSSTHKILSKLMLEMRSVRQQALDDKEKMMEELLRNLDENPGERVKNLESKISSLSNTISTLHGQT